MHVHFIIHEEYEAPGAYLFWAIAHNYDVSITNLYNHDSLDIDISKIDLLIIMGGPQKPNTTLEECSYFDSLKEQSLIKKAIDNNVGVIGVCLGAQLIGEALGAKFEHSPYTEIGIQKLEVTNEGKKDSLFNVVGDTFCSGEWHNDMPGLTKDAVILAKSEGCPRQVIKYKDLVYGFQAHLEFTRRVVEKLILNQQNEISGKYVTPYETILKYNYTDMNHRLYLFLDKLEEKLELRVSQI